MIIMFDIQQLTTTITNNNLTTTITNNNHTTNNTNNNNYNNTQSSKPLVRCFAGRPTGWGAHAAGLRKQRIRCKITPTQPSIMLRNHNLNNVPGVFRCDASPTIKDVSSLWKQRQPSNINYNETSTTTFWE